MVPLVAISILFFAYINQRHFQIGRFLTSMETVKLDTERVENQKVDFTFAQGAYIQPEFKSKLLQPDNLDIWLRRDRQQTMSSRIFSSRELPPID
mmetsp:Transcript_65304/g.77302  ORF Transcript_65304/g.77302 Transcript_65304/m.77302 type:complete len:95 (-) Transcript_65304:27-311(-)